MILDTVQILLSFVSAEELQSKPHIHQVELQVQRVRFRFPINLILQIWRKHNIVSLVEVHIVLKHFEICVRIHSHELVEALFLTAPCDWALCSNFCSKVLSHNDLTRFIEFKYVILISHKPRIHHDRCHDLLS